MRTALPKVPCDSLDLVASTCDAPGTMSRRLRASRYTVWEALGFLLRRQDFYACGTAPSLANLVSFLRQAYLLLNGKLTLLWFSAAQKFWVKREVHMLACGLCGFVTVRDSGECKVMVVCDATVTVLWSAMGPGAAAGARYT
ncbi:hypothetical protein EVAR_92493_1 [Eumeta japonica]|uniref:Uncharacterized protein n=1 Tax=Eumeta variegata TaxID=151549 RepID=A0A4C1T6C5_EUMVA|nr:hypothetical protein EVAR_92493_1 [Eumeta japonica]